jgi:hypothetical protein
VETNGTVTGTADLGDLAGWDVSGSYDPPDLILEITAEPLFAPMTYRGTVSAGQIVGHLNGSGYTQDPVSLGRVSGP